MDDLQQQYSQPSDNLVYRFMLKSYVNTQLLCIWGKLDIVRPFIALGDAPASLYSLDKGQEILAL